MLPLLHLAAAWYLLEKIAAGVKGSPAGERGWTSNDPDDMSRSPQRSSAKDMIEAELREKVEDWIRREHEDREMALQMRDRAEKERNEARGELQEALIQAASSRKKLSAAQQQASHLGAQSNGLATRLASTEERLRQSQSDHLKTEAQLTATSEQLSLSKDALQTRTQELRETAARLRHLQSDHEDIGEVLRHQRDRCLRAQEASESLLQQLAVKEKELEGARDLAQQRQDEADRELHEARAEAHRSQGQAKHAERALQAAIKEMAVLMEEADSLRGELQAAREVQLPGSRPSGSGKVGKSSLPGHVDDTQSVRSEQEEEEGEEKSLSGSNDDRQRLAQLSSQLAFFRAESVADKIRLKEQAARIHWLEQALEEAQVAAKDTRTAWKNVEAALHQALRSRSAAQHRRLALLEAWVDERASRVETQEVLEKLLKQTGLEVELPVQADRNEPEQLEKIRRAIQEMKAEAGWSADTPTALMSPGPSPVKTPAR